MRTIRDILNDWNIRIDGEPTATRLTANNGVPVEDTFNVLDTPLRLLQENDGMFNPTQFEHNEGSKDMIVLATYLDEVAKARKNTRRNLAKLALLAVQDESTLGINTPVVIDTTNEGLFDRVRDVIYDDMRDTGRLEQEFKKMFEVRAYGSDLTTITSVLRFDPTNTVILGFLQALFGGRGQDANIPTDVLKLRNVNLKNFGFKYGDEKATPSDLTVMREMMAHLQ